MSNDLLSAALACIRGGVSIVPINHTTKQPAWDLLPSRKWKPYQDRIATEEEVRTWCAAGIQSFAVVCGKVSGGMLVIDFDRPGYYERWMEAVGDLAAGLAVQQTGGGCFQVHLRCADPGGNDKLAWAVDEVEESGRTIAIETRGEGGYAVIAPSLHPSGNRYQWLSKVTSVDTPTVEQERVERLLAAARALDAAPMTRQEQERLEAQATEAHQQRHARRNGQASVIDAYNAAHAIEAELERRGYVRGPGGRYVRPGGRSESVLVKDGRSIHWSSNDPLNDGRGKGGCGCHDAFDVYTYFQHGGDVHRAVRAAADELGMAGTARGASSVDVRSDPWMDPQPLPVGLPAVLPFTDTLLPSPFRGWVADIADRMQCPIDYLAVSAMVAEAALLGRKVAIRPKRYDDWCEVPNLYGMCVGRPSLMKSPAIQEALSFLHRLEGEAEQEYAREAARHETEKIIRVAQRKVDVKRLEKAVAAGEDAADLAAAMAGAAEEAPIRRRYLVNDCTVEKLGIILNENPNGVLIFRDELIGFLRTMDREGHEGDRAFYLTAWNGKQAYTYDRIGRGTLRIDAAIVSIIGGIQPGVIHDYLRAAVRGGAGDDGLAQRFQLAVWPDVSAEWVNVDRYPDSDRRQKAYDAYRLLADLRPELIEAQRDPYDADRLPFLRFEDEAQEVVDGWRGALEKRLRAGVEHPAIESHLAKYRSLMPTMALLIHLAEGGVGPVSRGAAERAAGWMRYLESHARRLYAGVTEASAIAARELARRIIDGDVSDGFAARDVYRRNWSGLGREEVGLALDELEALGWVRALIEETPGRDRTRYLINPKIWDTYGKGVTKVTEGGVGTVAGASVTSVSGCSQVCPISQGASTDRPTETPTMPQAEAREGVDV